MHRIAAWRWFASLLVSLTLAPAAFAQRDDEAPSVPRAITAAELRRYGDILQLSDDQRLAAELEYEKYLDEFEPLRAELIELASRFPKHSRERQQLNRHLPPLVARVMAHDQAYFDHLGAMLTDEQRERIPRIAALRERTMLTSMHSVAWIIGDGLPDLRELLERLDPPTDVPEGVDAALEQYESRFTPLIRGIYDAAMNLCGEDFHEANEPARGQLIDRVRAARSLNRETFERLAPMLDDRARDRWRFEFLLHAYGSAAETSRSRTLPSLDATLASDLTGEQRSAVQTMRDEIVREQRVIEATMMDLLDREAIAVAGPQGARGSDEYLQVVNATRQQFQSFDFDRLRSLRTLLGKDRVDALPKAEWDRRSPRMRWSAGCGVVSFVGTVHSMEGRTGVPGYRTDALLAASIPSELFNDLMALLRLEGESLEAATVAFNDYATQLSKDLEVPRRESYEYAPQGVRPAQPVADPAARATKAREFHTRTRAMVDAADAALFEQIRTILGSSFDEAAWARMQRTYQRARASIDIWWRGQSEPNQVCAVDFVRLLARERPDDMIWTSLAETLNEYEATLLAAHQQIAAAYATLTYNQIAQRDGYSGGTWGDDLEALHVHGRALAERSHKLAESMLEVLPEAMSARLWEAYVRQAFPPAFDDVRDMGRPLDRAIALPELTADQRARLAEARMNQSSAMRDNRRTIAALCAAYLPDVPGIGGIYTEERTRRDERFQEELQKLRDQRDATNREALRVLRTTLAPAQLRQVHVPDMD